MSTKKRAHVWAVVGRGTGAVTDVRPKCAHEKYHLATFRTRKEAREYMGLWGNIWRVVKLTEGAS